MKSDDSGILYRYTENRDTGQIGTVLNTGIDTWNTGIVRYRRGSLATSQQYYAVRVDLCVCIAHVITTSQP